MPINRVKKIRIADWSTDFDQLNKEYYRQKEDYDWVEVTDHIRGLESFFHRLRERNALKLIKKFARGEKWLDAGCGTGLILRHLPVLSVGLDINPRHLAKAEKYLSGQTLALGDLEKMPFPADHFSTVICMEVLEHFPHPVAALKEVWRVLAPGGVLIGTVPRLNPIWKLRVLSSTHPGEPYHKEYGREDLEKIFEDKKRIVIESFNCFMSWAFVLEK